MTTTVAKGLYQTAIDAGVIEDLQRDAITDLDDYLYLFPTDKAVRECADDCSDTSWNGSRRRTG